MSAWVEEAPWVGTPEALAWAVREESGLVLLESPQGGDWGEQGRYSLVAAAPFARLFCWGSRCELEVEGRRERWVRYGNPWSILDDLMRRYDVWADKGVGMPLGGAFGFWGYGLRHFTEPRLPRQVPDDLDLPDSVVGFYSRLVVFDHQERRCWVVSTGQGVEGSMDAGEGRAGAEWWKERLAGVSCGSAETNAGVEGAVGRGVESTETGGGWEASLGRDAYVRCVERAQRYIRAGDIYQANLSRRLHAPVTQDAWELYRQLKAVSPAPHMAFMDCGRFQLVSSSPELFLRFAGEEVVTRPIKGTRRRGLDGREDAGLGEELVGSAKERAELVMITDLLRNDLGRVCAYGSVHVPELMRLEKFAQVQHLVSTVAGRLRPTVSQVEALAACFPGGSVTGAPKIRAMEIIEELEPVARGPYTGAGGYLGFNGVSQLSVLIRTALCTEGGVYFHTGAGIVADSDPEAEYAETEAKASGWKLAMARCARMARGGVWSKGGACGG